MKTQYSSLILGIGILVYRKNTNQSEVRMSYRESLMVAALIALTMASCEKSKSEPIAITSTPTPVMTVQEIIPAGRVGKEKFIPIPDSCPKNHYVYLDWNLHDFGKSKSPEILDIIAEIGREADIIAGQEINAGSKDHRGDGPQTVAKLADILNRKGSKWTYIFSDRTEPDSNEVERYAYWWNPSKAIVNHREAHLLSDLQGAIEREPYSVMFHLKESTVTAFSIHTVPTAKNPIEEVEALAKGRELNEPGNMILSGDFNLSWKTIDPILSRIGFTSHIREKTSLKQKIGKKGEYVFKQYDNIYTKGNIEVCSSGVIDFPAKLFSPVTDESLKAARKVSDHLPVYIVFYFKGKEKSPAKLSAGL